MTKKLTLEIAHTLPDDLSEALKSSSDALYKWESLTPLARNEWICWCISVKQPETRKKHIDRTVAELKQGKRRPCCWIGCANRTDKAINPTQKWILKNNY